MKTYRGAGLSAKAFWGTPTSTTSPMRSISCTSREPPRPSATRSTAMVYRYGSSRGPHREYCRTRPDGNVMGMCAPAAHAGSRSPVGLASTTEITSVASSRS